MKWSRPTIQLWGEFCISLSPSNPSVFVFPSNPFVFVFPSHPFQPQEENCLFWLRWAGNCESKWSHCRNENTSNSFGKFIWGAHSSKNCESLSGFLKKIVGIQCFAKGVGKAKGQKIPHSFTLIMLLINFVASKSLNRLFWPKILPGPAIKSTLTLQIYFYQINCPKICLKLGHKKTAQLCLMQAPSELRGSFHPYCLHPLPRPVLNKEYNTMMMMQILYWGDDEVDHHHVWHFQMRRPQRPHDIILHDPELKR